MNKTPSIQPLQQYHKEIAGLSLVEWLLRAKAAAVIRSIHFWIISALVAVISYIYYADLIAYPDVYVVLFLLPLVYAAIVYRLRGAVGTWLVFLIVLLPHALLFSEDPISLARCLAFAFLISSMIATQLNYTEQQLEAYRKILTLNEELSSYIQRLESTQKQLIQAEKLNALGQLSASIAHEINNPLAGALVYSKLLTKKLGGNAFNKDEALANLAKVETAISFSSGIVKDLLDFARQSEPKMQALSVSSVIEQVISMIDHQAMMKQVEIIREDISPPETVMADSDQLKQVLINLTLNAIQAMPDGGKLTIRNWAGEDGWVRISVQDTGTGIAPENMEKLFTPFFTTKERGKGVGLGLAVSYGIVERHGGKIDVESELGKGSTFTVRLPAYHE